MNESQSYTWCEFEAYQSSSILIEYVLLALQILIFLSMTYAYLKAKKSNQLDRVSNIYKYIIVWLVLFFLKTLINIIAYFVYMVDSPKYKISPNITDNDNIITGLKVMSSIFIFLDVLTTYFLQNTMIIIPYVWLKNALSYTSQMSLQFEQRKKIGRIFSFLEIIKLYMYFRVLYILFFIVVLVMIVVQQNPLQFGKYISIISIIESFVILSIYFSGLLAYRSIRDKLALNEKQQKNLLIEYATLLICNLIRIFLNSAFYFSNIVHYEPDQYCYDGEDPTFNCIYLSLGTLLMHIIPGSMILYIYWPAKKDKNDLRTSLLVSSFQKF